MKNLKIKMMLMVLGICFSCNNYLDLKPYGQTIPETPEEFSALLHSILNDIDYGVDRIIIGNSRSVLDYESYADNLDASLTIYPGGNQMDLYVGPRLNGYQEVYRDLYAKIRDCNLIIENMENQNTETGKDILATAYTLRGVCYYNLLRWFCEPYDRAAAKTQLGLPLVSRFDMEAKTDRSSMEKTVEFIRDDLKKGISFNLQKDIYRFKVEVAKAYLAKLYFWVQDWDHVIPIAEELLTAWPLLQGDEYVKMIQDKSTTKSNIFIRSYIFQSSADDSEIQASTSAPYRPVSKSFIDLFTEKEADIRYTLSFNKKREETKVLRGRVRCAEMALMLAESFAQLSDTKNALKYLNLLRSHRISPYTPYTVENLPEVNPSALLCVDATGKPLTKLMAAILNERQKELFMEGDRWFELKRNGRPEFWVSKDGQKYVCQKFMYTAPISRNDLALVPGMRQNPGYE